MREVGGLEVMMLGPPGSVSSVQEKLSDKTNNIVNIDQNGEYPVFCYRGPIFICVKENKTTRRHMKFVKLRSMLGQAGPVNIILLSTIKNE